MTMTEARMLAAGAWCHPKCRDTVMDVDLAEAFAEILEREANRPAVNVCGDDPTDPHFSVTGSI